MKLKAEDIRVLLHKLDFSGEGGSGVGDFYYISRDRITIFDGKTLLSYPYDFGFTGVFPRKEFKSIIDISQGGVEFNIKEGRLEISSSSVTARLAIINIKDVVVFPTLQIILTNEELFPIPEEFMDGIKFCRSSVIEDPLSVLSNIYVSRNEIYSSDNIRVSQYTIPFSIRDSLLIPYYVVDRITSHTVNSMYTKNSWVCFNVEDNGVFCFLKGAKNFPECSELFNLPLPTTTIEFPEEITQYVGKLSNIAEGEFSIDKTMQVEINKNIIKLKASKEGAWVEVKIDTTIQKTLVFSINPVFLEEILKHTRIALYIEGRLLFEGNNFKQLIALY